MVDREYAGWRTEQRAWHEGVALLNLSHRMYDMWIEGPDATRVLAEHGANDFEQSAIGQDVERAVLFRAVLWHAEDRVIRNGNHTIVFA